MRRCIMNKCICVLEWLSVLSNLLCFKQRTAYEMRMSDWSSDVCSSDLGTMWLTERKPSSVSRDYRTLAAICRFAVDQDLIVRSPCRGIKLPTGARRSIHVIAANELARLAKAMGEYGPMAYVAAVLCLRWGEVAGLTVGALGLENRSLPVSAQKLGRAWGGESVSTYGE